MHSLAQRVLSHIRRQELLRAGDRVGVAVSGGIDSVALLRVLLELRGELGIVLSVVHFNHRLRGAESEADQEFVAGLAREYGLEFYCDGDDVAGHAAEEHVSVETAARDLRYGFFRYLLGQDAAGPQGLKPDSFVAPNGTAEAVPFHEPASLRSARDSTPIVLPLDKIVTGHTLDDQAETVLMRMIRGAGLRGLGGIHPRILVEDEDGEACGEIVRPLLDVRHRELDQYLKEIGQGWREDSSNADERFTRNRVRKLVVPSAGKGIQSRGGGESGGAGGDCARRRGLLGERSFGLAGNDRAVVGAGVGAGGVCSGADWCRSRGWQISAAGRVPFQTLLLILSKSRLLVSWLPFLAQRTREKWGTPF